MNSIKTLIAEEASVIRDGQHKTVSARDLVVGDVVTLSMGDRVPADLRLVQISSDIRFDRSLLTGERYVRRSLGALYLPLTKCCSDMIPGTLDITSENALETRNLALTSTFVVQGSCTGVVFAIGDKSVMGRIVAMSGTTKFKLTTVQREVWFFTKIISTFALGLFALSLIIWAAWLRKSFPGYETASVAIINSIGCLTAFVPQGLPVCVALSLTIIAKRMAKRNVLVKNLATIETLGCMSVLCSDKTGTLTLGKMASVPPPLPTCLFPNTLSLLQTVENVAFFDAEYAVNDIHAKFADPAAPSAPAALRALHMIGRLCNGAKFDAASAHLPVGERQVKGDATDTAVLRFAEALSVPSLEIDTPALLGAYDKFFEIPFNSRNKWMLAAVQRGRAGGEKAERWMLVKGGPDVLFPKCAGVMRADGTVVPLDAARRAGLHALQERWSSEGQRVLALCRREIDTLALDPAMPANDLEELMYANLGGLTLVGLVGIRDPPRADVPDAIGTIRRAGVRVFMVTGDFKLTALSIARQVRRVPLPRCNCPLLILPSAATGRDRHPREGRHGQGDAPCQRSEALRGPQAARHPAQGGGRGPRARAHGR